MMKLMQPEKATESLELNFPKKSPKSCGNSNDDPPTVRDFVKLIFQKTFEK